MKSRLQNIAFIFIVVSCTIVLVLLGKKIYEDKIVRDKAAEKQKIEMYNDSISNANLRKWVIDTIIYKGKVITTIAHNVEFPKLGVKIEDTIKPTYEINDTINFTK